jgi:hypothetical protein
MSLERRTGGSQGTGELPARPFGCAQGSDGGRVQIEAPWGWSGHERPSTFLDFGQVARRVRREIRWLHGRLDSLCSLHLRLANRGNLK